MAEQVIGLGAGGHAKVVIEILRMNPAFELVGLLDSDPKMKGQTVLGIPVLGGDEIFPQLAGRRINRFFIGLGGAANTAPRRRLYELAMTSKLEPVPAIHPQAVLSPSAVIGPGVTIMAGALVNAEATLGANVIVNTGAIVEHDCFLGDHVHVATGARLAGMVSVGAMAHIGAGATIRQCVTIGEGAVIGAGAVVIRDVPPHVTVVGVPARELKTKMESARG